MASTWFDRSWARAVIGISFLAAVGRPAAGGVHYSITDLGDLPGGLDLSAGAAISATGGMVTGYGEGPAGDRAYRWSSGTMIDLGSLGGPGRRSRGFDVNQAGQVVGVSEITGFDEHAFLWQNGAMTNLGHLPGGANRSLAYGINAIAQVVGVSAAAGGDRAFLWNAGQMSDLGVLPGASSSRAFAINDAGAAVGDSTAATTTHAFLYSNGSMTDLGTLPGGDSFSQAFSINNSGVVAGISGSVGVGRRPVIWHNGSIQDLGPTPGGFADTVYSTGINDAGAVVGYSQSGNATRYWIWDPTSGMRDLGALVDAGPWTLFSGIGGIDNQGQIVGTGRDATGVTHAILLTPIPEPQATPVLLFALFTLCRCRNVARDH